MSRGDIYVFTEKGKKPGLNSDSLVYTLLRTGHRGYFNILILNVPKNWHDPVWQTFKREYYPFTKAFVWDGLMESGNLSPKKVSNRSWMYADIPEGMVHHYAGNLFRSLDNLVK